MKDPRRRSVLRLLAAPVALLVAVVLALQALEAATPRPVDPTLVVGGLPSSVPDADVLTCARDGDDRAVELAAASSRSVARVTSTMVTACPTAFDGRTVTYVGELVGDLLRRDGGAWVLVNDDPYALEVGPLPAHGDHRGTNGGLSVWLPDELLRQVTGLGRPNRRGDVVEVTGHVRRSDPSDGGGLTLRADTMQVLAVSVVVDEPFDVRQAWFMVGAVVIAVGSWRLRSRSSRRRAGPAHRGRPGRPGPGG